MLTYLFSLFYVTGEFHRFLHQGRATKATAVGYVDNEYSIISESVKIIDLAITRS